MDNLENVLEGLLFISGEGLERGMICEKLQVTPKQLEKAVEKLQLKYCEKCGINIIAYRDKLQLTSNPLYAEQISEVLNQIREKQLSKATLEAMAIIAYKQPITRLEIEEIRGVNSDYAIQTLINFHLIETVGRKDAIGKPMLFGTTDEFLKRFQLKNLDDLPDYEDLLKQIESIENENNHLYNEFEIPDEENTENSANSNESVEESIVNTEIIEPKQDLTENVEALNLDDELVTESTLNEDDSEMKNEADLNFEDLDEIPDFLKDEINLQKIG